ncbi:unnamed protein product, partial [Scytosiphon promiscuus]
RCAATELQSQEESSTSLSTPSCACARHTCSQHVSHEQARRCHFRCTPAVPAQFPRCPMPLRPSPFRKRLSLRVCARRSRGTDKKLTPPTDRPQDSAIET